ncbi:MAG: hypothetical protein JW769_04465 [Parachlamydiales bacterium]|nr:hypothetical protein [Parachlamydiales bacterium]
MKTKTIKRPFTLLEILVTCVLLLSMGSLLAIGSFRLWKAHCFYYAEKKMKSDIEYCRAMSFLCQCDYFLDLEQDAQGMRYTLYTDSKEKKTRCFSGIYYRIEEDHPASYQFFLTAKGSIFPFVSMYLISPNIKEDRKIFF